MRSALSTVYLMDCIEGMKQFPDKIFDLAVVDTHLGSGSIAVACYDEGYDLVGIEIDKKYFEEASKS